MSGALGSALPAAPGDESDRTQAGHQQGVSLRLGDGGDLQTNDHVVVVAVDPQAVIDSEDEVVAAAQRERSEHGSGELTEHRLRGEIAQILTIESRVRQGAEALSGSDGSRRSETVC